MAAIGVALNPAAASAVGLALAYAFKHGWVSLRLITSDERATRSCDRPYRTCARDAVDILETTVTA
jgi:hypothetical protein